jgi:hypothetical protein
MFGLFYELPVHEPWESSLTHDLPIAIGWSRCARSPREAVGRPDRDDRPTILADDLADVLPCAGLLWIAGHLR